MTPLKKQSTSSKLLANSDDPPDEPPTPKRPGRLLRFLVGSGAEKKKPPDKGKQKASFPAISPVYHEPITFADVTGKGKGKAKGKVVDPGQARRYDGAFENTRTPGEPSHPIAIPGARGRAQTSQTAQTLTSWDGQASMVESRGMDTQTSPTVDPIQRSLPQLRNRRVSIVALENETSSLPPPAPRPPLQRRTADTEERLPEQRLTMSLAPRPDNPMGRRPNMASLADRMSTPRPAALARPSSRQNHGTPPRPRQQQVRNLGSPTSPRTRLVDGSSQDAESLRDLYQQPEENFVIDVSPLPSPQTHETDGDSWQEQPYEQSLGRSSIYSQGSYEQRGRSIFYTPGPHEQQDLNPRSPPRPRPESASPHEQLELDGTPISPPPRPQNPREGGSSPRSPRHDERVSSNSSQGSPHPRQQLPRRVSSDAITVLQLQRQQQQSHQQQLPRRVSSDAITVQQPHRQPQQPPQERVNTTSGERLQQNPHQQPSERPHNHQRRQSEQPQQYNRTGIEKTRPPPKVRVGSAPQHTIPRGGLIGPPAMNPDRSSGLKARPPKLDMTIRSNIAPHVAASGTRREPFLDAIKGLLNAEIAFDKNEIPLALKYYSNSRQTPHIQFNIGQLHLFSSAPELAVENFERSIELDHWFCVGWMQLGGILFQDRRYKDAMFVFGEALRCFRNREEIDYEQLGLKYVVKHEEVLWNRAAVQRALELDELRGARTYQVPIGSLFRVPGRWARSRMKAVGDGTEWGFKGKGRVVAECESVYQLDR